MISSIQLLLQSCRSARDEGTHHDARRRHCNGQRQRYSGHVLLTDENRPPVQQDVRNSWHIHACRPQYWSGNQGREAQAQRGRDVLLHGPAITMLNSTMLNVTDISNLPLNLEIYRGRHVFLLLCPHAGESEYWRHWWQGIVNR